MVGRQRRHNASRKRLSLDKYTVYFFSLCLVDSGLSLSSGSPAFLHIHSIEHDRNCVHVE